MIYAITTLMIGEDIKIDYPRYRAFVGWPEGWDILSAMQFRCLTFLGLREYHYLLDIGCGSLRTGRLLIPYLLPGHYFGIEPEQWLIKEGIKKECGKGLIKIKKPIFSNDRNFTCTQFGQEFDFILAHSIFTHAPQSQIRRCISEVKKCMKPTGIFMATFLKGDNDYLGSEWSYPDCVEYTVETMKKTVGEFELMCNPVEWYHRNQTLILITFPGAKIEIPEAIPK